MSGKIPANDCMNCNLLGRHYCDTSDPYCKNHSVEVLGSEESELSELEEEASEERAWHLLRGAPKSLVAKSTHGTTPLAFDQEQTGSSTAVTAASSSSQRPGQQNDESIDDTVRQSVETGEPASYPPEQSLAARSSRQTEDLYGLTPGYEPPPRSGHLRNQPREVAALGAAGFPDPRQASVGHFTSGRNRGTDPTTGTASRRKERAESIQTENARYDLRAKQQANQRSKWSE